MGRWRHNGVVKEKEKRRKEEECWKLANAATTVAMAVVAMELPRWSVEGYEGKKKLKEKP